MSCWHRTVVLRIPAAALGFTFQREWDAFLKEHREEFDSEPGCFDESLSDDFPYGPGWSYTDFENPDRRLDQRNPRHPEIVTGPFLDYYIEDKWPLYPEENTYGMDNHAEPLDLFDKTTYLPDFRSLFPDFTIEQMDAVRYCSYEWYDGSNAPYLFSDLDQEELEREFMDEVFGKKSE